MPYNVKMRRQGDLGSQFDMRWGLGEGSNVDMKLQKNLVVILSTVTLDAFTRFRAISALP